MKTISFGMFCIFSSLFIRCTQEKSTNKTIWSQEDKYGDKLLIGFCYDNFYDMKKYCGIGIDTILHKKCIKWENSNYLIDKQFNNTTICQLYKNNYYCRTKSYYYYYKKYDWGYCKHKNCISTIQDINCYSNISILTNETSININLSMISLNYKAEIILYLDNNTCDITSQDCVMKIILNKRISSSSQTNAIFTNLVANNWYKIYLIPKINEKTFGSIIKLSIKTKVPTPFDVKIINKTQDKIVLGWQHQIKLIKIYEIEMKWNSSNINNYKTNNNYLVVSNLSSCSRYCFHVFARIDLHKSSRSNTICETTKAVFNNIRITTDQSTISDFNMIKWEYKNEYKCAITFQVQLSIINQSDHAKINFDNLTNENCISQNCFLKINLTNLEKNQNYMFKVRPIFEEEFGNISTILFNTNEINNKIEAKEDKQRIKTKFIWLFFVIIIIIILFGLLLSKNFHFRLFKSEIDTQENIYEIIAIPNQENISNRLLNVVNVYNIGHVIDKEFPPFVEKIKEESLIGENYNIEDIYFNMKSCRTLAFYQGEDIFLLPLQQQILINEYKDILSLSNNSKHNYSLSSTIGYNNENRIKNRYQDILPYNQNRVILKNMPSKNNYINASFIPFFDDISKLEFIACQAPLENTVVDFWWMIWQENVSLIVMLTKLEENNKSKCHQYWPNKIKEKQVFGNTPKIEVSLKSELISNQYIERVFDVSKETSNESRRIVQLQTISWDDYSTPKLPNLGSFIRRYHILLSSISFPPYLIHCSAGVGRTGTFITLEKIIRQIKNGSQYIDVFQEVMELRKYRTCLVQCEKQYLLIHQFIQFYLKKINDKNKKL